MEQYFEYRMITDFYIPIGFAIGTAIIFIIIGAAKLFIWLKDKRK